MIYNGTTQHSPAVRHIKTHNNNNNKKTKKIIQLIYSIKTEYKIHNSKLKENVFSFILHQIRLNTSETEKHL